MPQLSPHFHSNEFACNNAARTPVPVAYLGALEYLCKEILEPLREKFGVCRIHSGFRTSEHNRAVGGARNSFHVYTIHDADDVAADLSFRTGNVDQWSQAAKHIYDSKRSGKGGIGTYHPGNFVHLDTRDYQSRWLGS